MTLVCLGILLLAFSWLRALPVFYEYQAGSAVPWVVAGTALIVFGLRSQGLWREEAGRGRVVALLLCSTVGLTWLDGPFRLGFVVLAFASAVAISPLPRALRRWVGSGLFVAGAVHVIQAPLIPLLYVFCARYHRTAELPVLHDLLTGFPAVPWLAALLYGPLKLLNPGTSLGGATLYLTGTLDTIPLTPTWEKLGLFPAALFAAGVVFVSLLRPSWRRLLPGLLLWILAYLYVRLLVLLLLVADIRDESLFWQFDLLFYSFVLLPLVLGAWWRSPRAGDRPGDGRAARRGGIGRWFVRWIAGREAPEEGFSRRYRTARVVLASVLLVGGAIGFWGFHDPGSRKQGRVLIDEGHSDWEWTTQAYDTTWYGGKSGYNYYCLAEYWSYFYHVESRSQPLTPELLSDWDVLVLKTPTTGFTDDEVNAIERFVRDGGGLFLIGDHTNVFGTSTFLNKIAERFGMYFRYDATYNLRHLGLSLYERPERFAHPVTRFMPKYLFATSCTLYSPLFSENVILGYGLRAMYLDYSEISYFPVKVDKYDYDFGLFVQAGGVKCGKGRVLGFTDSTCFSNFFMFIPGKPELALASIEWLNRTNRWSWLNKVLFVVALIGLALLVVEVRRNSSAGFWSVVIAAGTLTAVVVSVATEGAVARAYPLPQPRRDPVHVTFDQGHGNYVLPSELLPRTNWRNFQTFYVWTQRLGLIPRNEHSIEDAVRNSGALVEINPHRPFSIEEIDRVVDFVRRGGTLVVLDTPENPNSTANQLVGPFGFVFDREAADSITVLNAAGDTLGVSRRAVGVGGVTPILKLGDGRTTMGYREFGEGKVVACGASYIFSSEYMGNTAVVPNAYQRRVYRVEYELFGEIAGLRVNKRYAVDAAARQ